jgi:hypothetical protein
MLRIKSAELAFYLAPRVKQRWKVSDKEYPMQSKTFGSGWLHSYNIFIEEISIYIHTLYIHISIY